MDVDFCAPEAHREINFYTSEDPLREAALGPNHGWAEQLPDQGDNQGKVEIDSDAEVSEDLHESTLKVLGELKKDSHLDFLKNCPPRFASFDKAFIINGKLTNNTSTLLALVKSLNAETDKGLPHLQEADVAICSKSPTRNGFSELQCESVTFLLSKK